MRSIFNGCYTNLDYAQNIKNMYQVRRERYRAKYVPRSFRESARTEGNDTEQKPQITKAILKIHNKTE